MWSPLDGTFNMAHYAHIILQLCVYVYFSTKGLALVCTHLNTLFHERIYIIIQIEMNNDDSPVDTPDVTLYVICSTFCGQH